MALSTSSQAYRSGSRGLVLALLALALVLGDALLVSPSAQAQRIAPSYFGMHDSGVATGSLPTVGLASVRLWDSGTAWRQIETSPGTFDFTALDTAVATAEAAGVRPLLVLGQTPQFYAQRPHAPGAYGDGATSMPNLGAWKRYVTEVAKRYQDTVDYQVWNEPNVISYWSGTVAQMVQLTATSSAAITKVVGRGATIVAPSFPLRLASQQKWYRSYWSSKSGGKSVSAFVDVVSANLYPLADQPPEASLKLLGFARKALPAAARRKPVWNTEINYGVVGGGGTAKEIPEARQSAYVARTLVLNAANKVSRVFWYSWKVGPLANTHLVDESNGTTLTPAGHAWDVARGWIVGTDVTGCATTSKGKLKGLYTCTARAGKSEVRRIYWKPTGRSARITTPATTTSWSDLAGETTARTGTFRITVGQAPVLVTSRR